MSIYTHNGQTVTPDEKIQLLNAEVDALLKHHQQAASKHSSDKALLHRQLAAAIELIEEQRQRLNDAAAKIKSLASRVKTEEAIQIRDNILNHAATV